MKTKKSGKGAAKESASTGVVAGRFDTKKHYLWLVLALVVAAALIGAAVFVALGNTRKTGNNFSAIACNDKTITDASKAIEAYDSNKLAGIVRDIELNPNHKTDVNCLYILTRYNLLVGDNTSAKKSIDSLKQSLKTEKYSGAFEVEPLSVAALEQTIEVQIEQGAESQHFQEVGSELDAAGEVL